MKRKRVILWGIIIFLLGIVFLRQQYMLYRLDKVQKEYNVQLGKIKIQTEQLKEQLKLTQRPDYYENLAREKLGLIKPGETLIVDKNRKR